MVQNVKYDVMGVEDIFTDFRRWLAFFVLRSTNHENDLRALNLEKVL